MSAVHLRDRRQITLPPDVVAAADLQVNDALEVSYVNGVIQLVPQKARKKPADLSRYLGALRHVYGSSTEEIDASIRAERDSWER
jgi:antitoxin component of MazEF toxin-antitoxin module